MVAPNLIVMTVCSLITLNCLMTPIDSGFYYLALFRNESVPAQFTIHGLWPQSDLIDYPQYCHKVYFNKTVLDPIVGQMNIYWPSDEPDYYSFWAHEWEKHGSCLYTPMTEFEYFNTVLNLYYDAWYSGYVKQYCSLDWPQCLLPVTQNFTFNVVPFKSPNSL